MRQNKVLENHQVQDQEKIFDIAKLCNNNNIKLQSCFFQF